MALIIHHLSNSRSQRIIWLAEELGLDYDVRRYERDGVTNLAPDELRALHPLGKSPLLEVEGRVIGESGAIVEYLCLRHGGEHLLPTPDSDDYIEHLQYMHFAEGSAMTPILMNLYAGHLGEAAAPLMPRIHQQLASHFQYMEQKLGDRLHFVGNDLTAADVMMSFPAEVAVMSGGTDFPQLRAFVEACHARPAWKRARERGGDYFIF